MNAAKFRRSTAAAIGLAGTLALALAPPTPASAATSKAPATVWLCRPGGIPDPCTADLDTTIVAANGTTTLEHNALAGTPPIDCFYVYPTVSAQKTGNSNLAIDPEETSVAFAQASRFSQVCRVFAPMYRSVTDAALIGKATTPSSSAEAYDDVQAAWDDYMAHYNDGRGVVLIGHSQGAFILKELIKRHIDGSTTLRRQLVSAILLGGNVLVPVGKEVGGDFEHIPGCESVEQIGCVVAYSSFDQIPPANSLFGRVYRSSSAAYPTEQVLCTNPGDLGGGSGSLQPYVPAKVAGFIGVGFSSTPDVSTPWISYPGLFESACQYQDGASWLQITDVRSSGDNRPHLIDQLGPTWGLHLVDVNLALGNLVSLVGSQSAAWEASQAK